MKIIFLGQNGILIESKKSTFVIDPYLSDSVAETEPQNVRRQKIDERFLKIKPDVVLITHSHADHYDEETLDILLENNVGAVLLAPPSVCFAAKKRYPECNCVYFRNGTGFSVGGAVFTAVKAEHSDPEAIGAIISCDDKILYVTGDTLYGIRRRFFADKRARKQYEPCRRGEVREACKRTIRRSHAFRNVRRYDGKRARLRQRYHPGNL